MGGNVHAADTAPAPTQLIRAPRLAKPAGGRPVHTEILSMANPVTTYNTYQTKVRIRMSIHNILAYFIKASCVRIVLIGLLTSHVLADEVANT